MQASRYDPDDPLAAALAPPPGESAEERAARVRREEEAKRVNDEIDERLREERAAWKRHRSDFKLLLLGQSESGTPTCLACPPPHALSSSCPHAYAARTVLDSIPIQVS